MCDDCLVHRQMRQQLVELGLSILSNALVAATTMRDNPCQQGSQPVDLHEAALTAYREGKITKTQYISVLDALDEPLLYQNVNIQSSSIVR